MNYHVEALVTGETRATFRLERMVDGGIHGPCYDLLRWNGDLYVLIRKNVELFEALCYLEYIRVNGLPIHAAAIEAFEIDTATPT